MRKLLERFTKKDCKLQTKRGLILKKYEENEKVNEKVMMIRLID